MQNKIHISEEHIYRWECPACGHHNTAYYKEVPGMINCANCPGCEYNTCRDTEHHVPTEQTQLEEIADIEKMNFLAWYRDATVEEIAIARRNNAAKLDELTRKYEKEINLIEIIMPLRRGIDKKTACDIAMKNATGTL